jgi:hypothetical protein
MNPLPRNSPPSAHLDAVADQLWQWFRVLLCVGAVPVMLVWLYSCFYL